MKSLSRFALAVVAGAPSLALAQPNGVVDQNRVDRRPQADRNLRKPATPPPAPPKAEVDIDDPAQVVPLKKVLISGSSLPDATFESAIGAYAGQPLTRGTATAITNAVAETYSHSDVALYTVVAPKQDLSTGELRLNVIEGYVTQVALSGDTKGDLHLLTPYGGKLGGEKPLTKPTLERYLSLIRDIPGLTVDAQMLAGEQPGQVVLALDLKQKKYDVGLSVTNRGSSLLGRTQLTGDLTFYGLARQGDLTRFTVSVPTEVERFQYYAITHSTPIGGDGLRAQVSAGYLRTKPARLPVVGKAVFAGVQVSYPVIRSYEQDLYLTAAFDGLDSTNAVFGQGTATERTRVARVAASWTKAKPKYAVSASGIGSFGIDGLGARTTTGLADADFRKLNAEIGFDRSLGSRWTVRLKAAVQATGDRLPASEQFGIGGDVYGRAFQSTAVIGDTGWGVSRELAFKALTKGRLKGSELYVFADAGRVTQKARFTLPEQKFDLASAGAGVRVAFGEKTTLGLEGAYGYDTPLPGQKKDWRLGVSFRTLR